MKKGAHGGGAMRPAKENAFDMSRMLGKLVHVEMVGGRKVTGALRGYDALSNLVLDQTVEEMDENQRSRSLGFVVVRGMQVSMVCPATGMEEISNPFLGQ